MQAQGTAEAASGVLALAAVQESLGLVRGAEEPLLQPEVLAEAALAEGRGASDALHVFTILAAAGPTFRAEHRCCLAGQASRAVSCKTLVGLPDHMGPRCFPSPKYTTERLACVLHDLSSM